MALDKTSTQIIKKGGRAAKGQALEKKYNVANNMACNVEIG